MKNKKKGKVKICVVATVDLSLRFLLFEQMKYWKRCGFEVWAVSSDGSWMREVREAGIRVQPIEMKRELYTPFADVVALVRLFLFFSKERFDIVHTNTPKASFLGQIAAFLARVPVRVNTVHGLFFQSDSSWRRKVLFLLVEIIISRLAHVVFFVNREDMTTAQKSMLYDRSKIRYQGGGINVERFNSSRVSEKWVVEKKHELGISPDTNVIGIVARLVWEKGFAELFVAIRSVVKVLPQTVLLVVGPTEPGKTDAVDMSIVAQYGVKDNVLFVGEQKDIVPWYQLMDVFVLPSYREGLGLSLLEASAMEKPVIASDIRGCREAVDDGKTGMLVPVKNSEKLAEALTHILLHADEAMHMGELGRKKVAREFDEHLMLARIQKEYNRFIHSKART